MKRYLRYWADLVRCAVSGSIKYYGWLAFLGVLVAIGLASYLSQLRYGLAMTNLSDQVSWGAYIANFTFLVGIAAAAVLLVIPTYVYNLENTRKVVLIAELMAACAMIMCLMFVMVDLGRPERFFHLLPFVGRLNLPSSMLAWDVVVLSGYLLMNLHIPGYLLFKLYIGEEPSKWIYRPFVYLSIGWAVTIHTVTAFLYGGFGGRPFWNTAIMAPRFLISAFASGPALLLIVFWAIGYFTKVKIEGSIFKFLRRVISIALPVNYFLLACELFKEFYTDSTHAASAEYLFFGLFGNGVLVPYIWTGLILGVAAMVIFWIPKLYKNPIWMLAGATMCILGVWIEKGMGLIVPGFIPTPMGDLVEYQPSATEFLVSLGIWAFGAMLFTVVTKVALAIQSGELRANGNHSVVGDTGDELGESE